MATTTTNGRKRARNEDIDAAYDRLAVAVIRKAWRDVDHKAPAVKATARRFLQELGADLPEDKAAYTPYVSDANEAQK